MVIRTEKLNVYLYLRKVSAIISNKFKRLNHFFLAAVISCDQRVSP